MKVTTAVLGAVSRAYHNGRAKSRLKFCVIPALVVLGLVALIIAFAPAPPASAGHAVTSADCAGCGDSALGSASLTLASPARPTVNAAPVSVRAADLRARAAGIQAAETAARDELDHQFHLAHLAHLRHLAEQAAAQALGEAVARATAYAAAHPPKTLTVTVAPAPVPVTAPQGDYSCSALESLWESAGGSPGEAFTAAEIATAESGGNPGAISPTDDYGLWQINAGNAPGQEMLNPYANVREAVSLSGDGSDWSPWTTYTSGAYEGRC